jgi:Uncharacterised ArCR, COG2043
MKEYRSVETKFSDSLRLKKRPVAVTFLETPSSGVLKFEGAEPSGCSFWRFATAGKTFYTAITAQSEVTPTTFLCRRNVPKSSIRRSLS